ncbi:hypothetical protein AVEN_61205-1 [Araneus ventricosus]|uniref:Uncharacterized protein n=1 Tax=Araneus ventricosus TaxID=182803 RepID=A0A4Y2L5J8_ARAVE|nr:hypothetical protein AVEN_61205-1 [Araneus ventricosus]
MSPTKRVAKRMRRLVTLRSRSRNLFVCKFPMRMEKIKATSKYSLVDNADFVGVKLHSETTSDYTNGEYTDMHLIYDLAGGNGRLTQRMYQEQDPRRRCPHLTTSANIDKRLRETGSFKIRRPNAGQERSVLTNLTESRVFQRFPIPCRQVQDRLLLNCVFCTKWCGRLCVLKACPPSTCRKFNSYEMTITPIG